MARFIDAEDVLEALSIDHGKRNDQEEKAILDAWDRIKKIPSADVVEVKHGEWVEWWDDNYLSYCHKCSECGSYPLTKEETMHDEVLSAYCPYCGAKMDGERREADGL